jgi:ATP adenylyltransferase
LNKYPVIPQHFIIATKLNKQQTHMLEKDDLAATHACLKAWEENKQNGKLFAFFNSGEHSGASQAHRHLQFLSVTEMKRDQQDGSSWDPLIERMLEAPAEGAPGKSCTHRSGFKSDVLTHRRISRIKGQS